MRCDIILDLLIGFLDLEAETVSLPLFDINPPLKIEHVDLRSCCLKSPYVPLRYQICDFESSRKLFCHLDSLSLNSRQTLPEQVDEPWTNKIVSSDKRRLEVFVHAHTTAVIPVVLGRPLSIEQPA
jgi:hypothetical protein